jgi:flagellar biosynthesis protein FlhA
VAIINGFGITSRIDMIVGLAVVAIVGVMLIPIPSPLLDVLIATNVTFSVILLLLSLYILEPIGFSVFPTLLLLLTLFRLSLNVASTRLILLDGPEGPSAAGKVIESFGQFVVGGNYVVGAVIFLVLIAIQYIVVNHGAVRISEVTARFTLDAMPGKQMSIDADLSAGLIDEQEARERRRYVSREAEFYGAMDGAVRFTQRDAVASIIIVLINIIAGFLIGVLSYGMEVSEAITTFSILTIGDGLVSAIPALLIAVTAGVMTTRAASESNLGEEVTSQVFSDPKPVALGAAMVFLIAFIPGLPFLAFFILGSAAALAAWWSRKGQLATEESIRQEAEREAEPAAEERIEALMRVDPLGLELGYQLIHLVDSKPGADFLSRVKSIRRQLALELGVVVPPVHITDNLQLRPREYRILLKGVPVAGNELMPGCMMAINPGQVSETIEGVATQEPTFDLPASWVKPETAEKAQLAGYTVVDNTTVLATHLTEVIKSHVHELLGRQDVRALLDSVVDTHPKVIEELVPKVLSYGEIQKVLQNLLRERVSIRDLVTILEVLADYAPRTRNVVLLTEYVRQALGRSICQPFVDQQGEMKVFTLSGEVEKAFQDAVTITEQESYLALEPVVARSLLERIQQGIESKNFDGYPVLLASSPIRMHVKRFVENILSHLVVLSHNEIPPKVRLISLGEVT